MFSMLSGVSLELLHEFPCSTAATSHKPGVLGRRLFSWLWSLEFQNHVPKHSGEKGVLVPSGPGPSFSYAVETPNSAMPVLPSLYF